MPDGQRKSVELDASEWEVVKNVMTATLQNVQNQAMQSQKEFQVLQPLVSNLARQLMPQPGNGKRVVDIGEEQRAGLVQPDNAG